MKKELIKQAATVEEAKALIAAEFGVAEDAITFEVLQEPGKKVLGLFGGSDAEVKGTIESGSAAEAACEYLKAVLGAMGVTAFTYDVKEIENGCVITLDGEDLGFIIGRRGDTLDALQYLAGLVGNRAGNAYYRVTLDIGNYREKREQALIGLAKRLGGQTARTGRRHSLEPMNPYERRIIHTAVQDMEGVISWSVGSEPNRHVIIGPSDDNPNKGAADERRGGRGGRNRGGRGGRGNGGRGGERRERRDREYEVVAPERPVREFISRSNPMPMADGATPPSRTESEKEQNASLYGRIDL
ncbi:MAG: protein jag [Clostridia bacterium]|nr:protein jag [Clostridia bacterium]